MLVFYFCECHFSGRATPLLYGACSFNDNNYDNFDSLGKSSIHDIVYNYILELHIKKFCTILVIMPYSTLQVC